MASSVTLKNRESKSKKRIMNRKPLALVLKIEKVGPWVSCVTEIIVAERKKKRVNRNAPVCAVMWWLFYLRSKR